MSLLGVNTMRLVGRRSFSVASVLSSDNAGAIRDAGGKFGEIETAAENVYFRKVEAQQLEALKKKHDNEIRHHEKQIQAHMDSIKRHREECDKLQSIGSPKE